MPDVALLLVGYSHDIVSDITDIVPRRRFGGMNGQSSHHAVSKDWPVTDHAVLLKPLSFHDPDRIVTLSAFSTTDRATSALSKQPVSTPDFQDLHDQSSLIRGDGLLQRVKPVPPDPVMLH
jgi:hypothetical protein